MGTIGRVGSSVLSARRRAAQAGVDVSAPGMGILGVLERSGPLRVSLLARRAGIPLCAWFGGPWRQTVAVDYWMGRVTPAHAQRCVARAKALGFTGVKLKTTLEDPNVERLEAIRDAGGVDCAGQPDRTKPTPPSE